MVKPLISQELIDLFRSGKYVACSNFHDGSCEKEAFRRMFALSKTFAMLYGPAHILPIFIFKLKQLMKNPIHVMGHGLFNMLRSVAFGSFFISVTQYTMCQLVKIMGGVRRFNWIVTGIASGATIFIEAESRRGDLALYLLPRVLETIWNLMKKYGWPLRIKYFEVAIFALAMGILSFFLHNDDKHIKPTYRSSLRLLLGTN